MKQRNAISILMSGLLSVCLAFLGLLGALELTLFKPGYLAECMDRTGYVDSISDVIQSGCQGYVTAAGLNTVVLDGYLDPKDVRNEVHRGVAERFRGSDTAFYQPHFSDLNDRIRSMLSEEELALEDEESLKRFELLQFLCENTFQEATRPPFDAALNTVLQYRAYRLWAYLGVIVLGAAAYLVLRRAVPRADELQRGLIYALLGGALALLVLAALLRWAMPYADWMPAENLSYSLFCVWWGGLAPVLALLGALAFAGGLLWAAWSAKQPAPAKAPAEVPARDAYADGERPESAAPDQALRPAAPDRELDISKARDGR